jgi:hypothetical protein
MNFKDNHNMVSLTGGLGNQLFQLAFALDQGKNSRVILEWVLGKPRINQKRFPQIECYELPINVELDKIRRDSWISSKTVGYMLRKGFSPKKFEKLLIFKAISKILSESILFFRFKKYRKIVTGHSVGYSTVELGSNSFIIGYFQSYLWTQNSNVYESLMSLSAKNFPLYNSFVALAKEERPLIVHIRLTDYFKEDLFGIPNASYYKSAINQQLESGSYNKVWIFSDEPETAINWLPEIDSNLIRWVPTVENCVVKTFEVMRLGYGFVIANSSFSWWAARLNHQRTTRIIFPSPWFRYLDVPDRLIPPEWDSVDAGWIN